MAVIINDLEVVVESEQAPESRTPSKFRSEEELVSSPQALAPHDLERILRQQSERVERIRAH